MKSKKFSTKYKIGLLIVLLIVSLFFKLKDKLISDAITCISIIFAFSQSFLLAAYTNQNINIYMKKHQMFDNFINDNKNFLKTSLFSLFFLFILNAFSFSYSYKSIYISSLHIALLIIFFQLFYTFDFADKYMNLYKNSYSDKVLKQKENPND